MRKLDTHFDSIHEIASTELGNANGCELLSNRLPSPFDSVNVSQIEDWVGNLSRSLMKKCWGSRDFKSSCKTHGDHLFYVAETGDVPEIINVGYPMMEIPHTFQNVGQLTDHSTILLPQLIENISVTSFNGEPYFECTDLFSCYLGDFGLKMPELDEFENMDASRLLVDSVAILAMIKSWRELDLKLAASVYFCTSSGPYAFGRPICVQDFAE